MFVKSVLSSRVNGVPPSGIRKFFDIAALMKDVVSLGIGEPDFVTPEHVTEAGITALRHGETHYTGNSGIPQLRNAISANIKKLYGVEYDPQEEVLVTVGVSEALSLVMQAIVDPGDEVIIPTPAFVAYVPTVILCGGKAVELVCTVENDFQIDPAALEAAITPRTKAILLGYPNNPTGAVMSRELLLKVAQIAEKHDLVVISDEVYDRLVYGVKHVCFAGLPGMRKRTITLQGFSKAYAMTGWRLGYACGPAEILGGMRKIHQYLIMSAPTVAQWAGVEALEKGEPDVLRMVAEYDRRRKVMLKGFNDIGLKCFEPKGAFYMFPNVTVSGLKSEAFCDALLNEEHVAVIPGPAFGAAGEGYVRACYATSMEKIEEALTRIQRFMRRHG